MSGEEKARLERKLSIDFASIAYGLAGVVDDIASRGGAMTASEMAAASLLLRRLGTAAEAAAAIMEGAGSPPKLLEALSEFNWDLEQAYCRPGGAGAEEVEAWR